jgi:hypothetical protein
MLGTLASLGRGKGEGRTVVDIRRYIRMSHMTRTAGWKGVLERAAVLAIVGCLCSTVRAGESGAAGNGDVTKAVVSTERLMPVYAKGSGIRRPGIRDSMARYGSCFTRGLFSNDRGSLTFRSM